MAEKDGPGKAQTDGTSAALGTWGRIYNFDTGSAELKPPHIRWLLTNIVPYLARGGSAMVKGQASRLGGDAENEQLSRARVKSVVNMLRYLSKGQGRIGLEDQVGWGERPAAGQGVADGDNAAFWRAVNIAGWDKASIPVIPPAPAAPVTMKRVIVHREFIELKTEKDSAGGPPSSDSGQWMNVMAIVFGKLFRKAVKPDGEQLDKRTYAFVPVTHAVRIAKVRLDYEVTGMTSGEVSSINITTVDYHWQPYVDAVSVFTDYYGSYIHQDTGFTKMLPGAKFKTKPDYQTESHQHNIYDRPTANLDSLYIPPDP